MISKYQNSAMGYFLGRATFLGIGFSLLIGLTHQDTIITFILGTIIGILFIFLINKVQQLKGEKELDVVLKEMKIYGIILRIILLLFAIYLFVACLMIFQLFASSFFLVKTSLGFITLPLIILIIFIAYKGLRTLYGVTGILFPISFFLTIISLITLFIYFKTDNIFPFFVSSKMNFIKSIIFYASLTTSPYMLSLINNQNNQNNFSAYIICSLTLIIKCLLIIGILGPLIASIYRFPEYLILREIRLLDFIEKIENIISLSWIFDTFIYLSLTSLFIKKLLPKKNNKIIYFILTIFLYFVTFKYIGKTYEIEIIIYYALPYICLTTFLIIIPSLLIYLNHKKKKL